MPGKMVTTLSQIKASAIAQTEEAIQDLIYAFQYVGEACVKEARDNHTYQDQTGNLSSSIGYCIVRDGKILSMTAPAKVKDGDDGIIKGQQYLDSLAKKWGRHGIVLIVSAGMNYAEYVEARGYVVLSSAEIKAPNILEEVMSQLGLK